MQKFQKLFLVLLVALMFSVLTFSNGFCKDKITLRLAYIYTGGHAKAPIYEPYIKEFSKLNPDINLRLEPMPGGTPDIQAKLYTYAAGDNLPDVFISWPGPGMLKNFVEANKIADLKDYLAHDGLFKNYFQNKGYFFDGSVRFEKNGPIWGIPDEPYYMFLTVNKKIFAQAGVTFPKTYEELKKVIPKFRAKGIIPIAMAGKDQDLNVCFWFGMLNRFGTDDEIIKGLTTGDMGKAPAYLKSARVIYELAGLKAFPEGCVSMQSQEALTLFEQGKAAMYYGGTWYLGNISSKTAADCEVIPLWTFADGKGDPQELLGGVAVEYLVSAKSWKDNSRRQAVDKLLHYLINPTLYSKYLELGTPSIPNLTYTKKTSPLLIKADKLAKAATRMQQNYDAYGSQQANDALNNLSQGLLNHSITPEEAVKQLSEQAKAGASN